MRFTIPKRFKLFDQWVDVSWNNKLVHQNEWLGLANFRDSTIEIQSPSKDKPIKKSSLDQTFFHELAHHIFNAINEDELRNNEKLVDQVGKCLYNFFDTREGRL